MLLEVLKLAQAKVVFENRIHDALDYSIRGIPKPG